MLKFQNQRAIDLVSNYKAKTYTRPATRWLQNSSVAMRKSKNFAGNSDCDTINVSPNPSSLKIAWVKSSLFSGDEVVKVQQKMKCTRWNMYQELFSTKASFTFRGFDRLIGSKPMGLSSWNTEHFFWSFSMVNLTFWWRWAERRYCPK